jgi:hypothetical protein
MAAQQQAAAETSSAMTAEEFDFFARHRGGFDRQFFSQHLAALLAGYCLRDGIQPTEVEVLVRLGAVREVRFRRRPGPPAAVGFSAAIVEEPPPPSFSEGPV